MSVINPLSFICLPFADMRFTLVIVCMFLISTIVGPVFYHLWTSTGSINSNFFFALTLVYSLSQVCTYCRYKWVCGCGCGWQLVQNGMKLILCCVYLWAAVYIQLCILVPLLLGPTNVCVYGK